VARWKNAVAGAAVQRELRQDVLYREAARAFRENGYHATSLENIAQALGISKPTLYHYVKTKGDLLFQVHMAASVQALACLCNEPGLSGLERLRRTVRDYTCSTVGEDSYSVVILEEKSLRPDQLAIVVRERDKFEAGLRGMIEDGIRDGSIVQGNPRFMVFNVLGTMNWVTKWYRRGGAWTIEEIGEGVSAFVCRALTPESAPRPCGNALFAPPPKAAPRSRRGGRG
jgi:TetR/AcrR family transcriptional regulator